MLQTLLLSSRLPFLVLTPACLSLGWAAAAVHSSNIAVAHLLLILLGAVSAHLSVNLLNEYGDFRTGLDLNTERTPFSGGSGGLVINPQALSMVGVAGLLTLLVASLVGGYFVLIRGIALLPIGLLGVGIILSYTHWLNRFPWFCLIAPGLAFGPLMVLGAEFCLTGHYSVTGLVLSLVAFFLTNNLLLLNQYPDVEADQAAGRDHFVIAYGRRNSNLMFTVNLVLTAMVIIVVVTMGLVSVWALLSLIPLVSGFISAAGAWRYADIIERLIPFMGLNVAAAVLVPLTLGVTVLLTV